jgi:hypothetical protein
LNEIRLLVGLSTMYLSKVRDNKIINRNSYDKE